MVVIKDMEMPCDCMECMFCNHRKSNDYGSYGDCAILGDNEQMNLLLHQKHPDCPLVDITTCKDCRHYTEYKALDGITYVGCYKGHSNSSPNFYCADAEGRE